MIFNKLQTELPQLAMNLARDSGRWFFASN